jgi:hypothetical protein
MTPEPVHGIPQGPFRCRGCGRRKWWLPTARGLVRGGVFLSLVVKAGRPVAWERHACAIVPAPKRSADYRAGYKNGWRAGRIEA